MKYDVTIDPDDTSTSHGLVIELVGTNKRVLDLGCSSGYLAEALVHKGNRVVGVELDPESVEAARARGLDVTVGDVETMDLVEQFGAGAFDVVVFADVLEHLRNPLGVLREARRLLSDTGFVVVSIPNVAHSSVRLALLQGRFDYSPTGLLDETHLRFFTRATVDDLLRGAGYLVSELHRTTAGPFDTEIQVDAEDFQPEVIDRLRADPEASTYQFVLRGIPYGSSSAAEMAMVNDLVEKGQAIATLRHELEVIARSVASAARPPRIGLIASDPATAVGSLRLAAVRAEMVRRLPGFDIRTYATLESPDVEGAPGDAAHPLLPWNGHHAARLLGEIDAAIVLSGPPATFEDPLPRIIEDLAASDLPLYGIELGSASDTAKSLEAADKRWSRPSAVTVSRVPFAGTAPLTVVSDPVALGGQLFGPALSQQRLEQLRYVGDGPRTERFLLVSIEDSVLGSGPAIWTSVDAAGRRLDAEVFVIGPGSPSHRASFAPTDPIDLVALVHGATLVVTDAPAVAGLAAAVGTPTVGIGRPGPAGGLGEAPWRGVPVPFTDAAGLVGAVEMALADQVERATASFVTAIESYLDELGDAVMLTAGRRLIQSVPQRLEELVDQIRVLEATNDGLRRALGRERRMFAEGARVQRTTGQPVGSGEVFPALKSTRDELDRVRFELDAVYGTRTMRAVQPARRVYAKLRSLRR